MKRILKISGIIAILLVVVLLAGYLFISIRGIPSYKVESVDYQHVSTPENIERGKKLAMMLCVNCHRSPETGSLTGTRMLDAPPEFGTIYSLNITQDKQYGIGEWTDGELVYLLRTGIKKDGKYSPIYMPKFPHMADEDINAIISFLRSDDELVKASAVADRPSDPSFLTKFLCTVAFKPLPMPTQKIELPDMSDKLSAGRYLAVNLECYSCHSGDFKKVNIMEPELSEKYFGGGNILLTKEGKEILSQNLTPDQTGIADWPEEKFVKALKYAYKEGETGLRYPMMPYPYLTDEEASAIYHYLKSIKPISNEIGRSSLE